MNLYTLTDLSMTTAISLGADSDRQAHIQRQIKNLLARQLITPTSTKGGRRDTLLDFRESAKARIQLAIVDAGMDAVTLHACAPLWDMAVDARLTSHDIESPLPGINGFFPPRGLDAVLHDAVRPDAPAWVFEVIIRYDVEKGERIFAGGFVREDQPEAPDSDPRALRGPYADTTDTFDAQTDGSGKTKWTRRGRLLTVARVTIPATTLIRSLLAVV